MLLYFANPLKFIMHKIIQYAYTYHFTYKVLGIFFKKYKRKNNTCWNSFKQNSRRSKKLSASNFNRLPYFIMVNFEIFP